MASDHETDTGGLPRFDLEDVSGIADFVVERMGLPRPSETEAGA